MAQVLQMFPAGNHVMQQWWEALDQLTALLRDADALGLSREARNRLIAAVGALDSAMITCAAFDCPLRVAFQSQPASATAKGTRQSS
jgi:hypothetical protein